MVYQKSSDKIKADATWKTPKQVWALRTVKSYLKKLIKEAKTVGNEDAHKIMKCIALIEEVIVNQISIK